MSLGLTQLFQRLPEDENEKWKVRTSGEAGEPGLRVPDSPGTFFKYPFRR